jgi:DNA-binding PadR family transcriptional regulator
MGVPRMTWQLLTVLTVLLDGPTNERYGLELVQETGILSGTLYPLLVRLERLGLLQSRWEQLDEAEAGRRRRRYYRLTPDGQLWAEQALVERAALTNRPAPRWV